MAALKEKLDSIEEDMRTHVTSYLNGLVGQLEKPLMIYAESHHEFISGFLVMHELLPEGKIRVRKALTYDKGGVRHDEGLRDEEKDEKIFSIEDYMAGRDLTQMDVTVTILDGKGYK